MTIKQIQSAQSQFKALVSDYKTTWGKCDGKTARKLWRKALRALPC